MLGPLSAGACRAGSDLGQGQKDCDGRWRGQGGCGAPPTLLSMGIPAALLITDL